MPKKNKKVKSINKNKKVKSINKIKKGGSTNLSSVKRNKKTVATIASFAEQQIPINIMKNMNRTRKEIEENYGLGPIINNHKLRELALKIIQKNNNTTNIGISTPPMLHDIEKFLNFSEIKESEYQQIIDSDDPIEVILNIRSRSDNYKLFFKSGDNEYLPWIVNSKSEKFLVYPDLEIFFNNQIFIDMVDDLIKREETHEATLDF